MRKTYSESLKHTFVLLKVFVILFKILSTHWAWKLEENLKFVRTTIFKVKGLSYVCQGIEVSR